MKIANISLGVALVALVLALIAGFSALPAFVLYVGWNALAPLFHGPHLTFLQAWIAWALIGLVSGAFTGSNFTSKK